MLEKIQQKFNKNKMMQNTKSTVALQQKKTPDVTHKGKKSSKHQMSSGEILQKFKESMTHEGDAGQPGNTTQAGDAEQPDDEDSDRDEDGRRGFAMVEMLLVMILFMLIGITIFTLIFAGSNTYTRLNDNKNTQAEARIAMSFINVKLRQNDSEGCVRVVPMPGNEEAMAIAIKEPALGDGWTTWIFWEDGVLFESQIEDTLIPSSANGIEVVRVDGFSVSEDEAKNTITSVIEYHYNDVPRTMSHTINMHAGLQGGG